MNRIGLLSMASFGIAFLLLAGCHVSTHHGHRPAPAPHVSHRPGPPAHAKAHGRRRYRYYYDSQVYFDIQTNHWFWISAGTWHSGASLPRTYRLSRSASVVVELETDKPYTKHAHVKTKHPGKGHSAGKAAIKVTPGHIKLSPGKVKTPIKGAIKVTPGKIKPHGPVKITPGKIKGPGPIKVTPGKIKLPGPIKISPNKPKGPSKGKGGKGKDEGKGKGGKGKKK